MVFATESWWRNFPLCKLFVIHTIVSDYDPVSIKLMNVSFSKKQFRFKVENT